MIITDDTVWKRIGFVVVDKDEVLVADCRLTTPKSVYDSFIGNFGRRTLAQLDANAALIAAAPELLSTLRELVDLVHGILDGDYTPDSFTTQPAKAAIAKATRVTTLFKREEDDGSGY